MNLSGLILSAFGWKVDITVPDYPKSIICVAPHTSNWDFILGKLAYASVGRKAGFLMKETWFFFPLGLIFKSIGGVPVSRAHKSSSLVDQLIKRFNTSGKLSLAITPEGTRSRNSNWHTGFLRIAYATGVPILLGAMDFPTKRIEIKHTFTPSGDIRKDMCEVKNFYKDFKGKYPEKFSID